MRRRRRRRKREIERERKMYVSRRGEEGIAGFSACNSAQLEKLDMCVKEKKKEGGRANSVERASH
uniref:Uncharacterized protein n=1 Tax=Pristionchus pacificus TaxID=54126 RepID=A0A2A6C6J4_PRIPA|eukprot:PDM73794.1 hypothetical protein PRIPAC_41150 [Pristionchus pacificus]